MLKTQVGRGQYRNMSEQNYSDCWCYPKEAIDEMLAKLKAEVLAEIASGQVDVQIAGTSIVDDGIANIPLGISSPGVLRIFADRGISAGPDGRLQIVKAEDNDIKGGATIWKPVVPAKQDASTFYGLAKAAGSDMKDSSNAVGNYTLEAKKKIADMLGVIPTYIVTVTMDNNAPVLSESSETIFALIESGWNVEIHADRMTADSTPMQGDGYCRYLFRSAETITDNIKTAVFSQTFASSSEIYTGMIIVTNDGRSYWYTRPTTQTT